MFQPPDSIPVNDEPISLVARQSAFFASNRNSFYLIWLLTRLYASSCSKMMAVALEMLNEDSGDFCSQVYFLH